MVNHCVVRLARLLSSNQVGGWLDQVVASASNLFIVLIVARWMSVIDLGYYAIAFSVFTVLGTVQDSLITRPYTVQMLNSDVDPRVRSAGALAFALSLWLSLTLILWATGIALVLSGQADREASIAFILGAAIPSLLLREFVRRYCFAHLKAWQAFSVDLAYLIFAILGFLLTIVYFELTVISVIVVMTLSCTASAGAWMFLNHRSFLFDIHEVRGVAASMASVGGWLTFGQIAAQAQSFSVQWIALLTVGPAATGVYTASLSVISLSNPLLFGYFNLLTPQFVRCYKSSGLDAVFRRAVLSSLLLGCLTSCFALFVFFLGDWILRVLFPGEEYQSSSKILVILAVALVASSLGGPATIALVTLDRAKETAILSAAMACAGGALILVLMVGWGLETAIYGVLAYETIGSFARWGLLVRLLLRKQLLGIQSPITYTRSGI